MTLGKSFSLSAPKFPHLEGKENNYICATDIQQQIKSTF